MNRKVILQVPLVLLAAVIVGILALVFWLVMLVPMLINPDIIKPITGRLSREFYKQMIHYLTGAPKSTPQPSQQSRVPLWQYSAQSPDLSQRFGRTAKLPSQQDLPPERKEPQT